MPKKYLALAVGILAVVCLSVAARLSGLTEFFAIENIRATVSGFGVYTPLAYMVLYCLAAIVFIPGTPLTLLGGALFGPLYGTLYAVIGATLGATLSFLIMRQMGGGLFRQPGGSITQRLSEYDQKLKNNGFATVLFLRLVPLFPFNGLNFALGVTSVRFRDFVLGTVIGIIPGTFVFVYFGDSLATVRIRDILIGLAGIIALTLGGRYLMKMNSKSYENKT